MRICELPAAEFDETLASRGVVLPCGPFVVRLSSPLESVAAGLRFHYRAFDLLPEGVFVDFDVHVAPTSLFRRFVRPQVNFHCDGQTPFKPLPARQAFPMLEWGLNWVISSHAHDHLVLHGAVVERNGLAVILAADPGSGKSTLCAAMTRGGWRLLSDELTLVNLDTGKILPIARPISLKNESIQVIRNLGSDISIGEVCSGTTKGAVAHMRPPELSVARRLELAHARWVVFPQFMRGGELKVEEEGHAHGFMEMTRHAFNYASLGEVAFGALADLASQCNFLRVSYGHLDQVLPVLDRLASQAGAA